MYEEIDFDQFNLPPSFQEDLKRSLDKRVPEFITLRATLTAGITQKILRNSKMAEEVFWDSYEIILLQHGTTKEQVAKMCRMLALQTVLIIYKDLLENIKEDTFPNE